MYLISVIKIIYSDTGNCVHIQTYLRCYKDCDKVAIDYVIKDKKT